LVGFAGWSIPLTIAGCMFRHVPNALTGLRLLLAFVFFSMLAWYQYEGRGNWLLNVALVISFNRTVIVAGPLLGTAR